MVDDFTPSIFPTLEYPNIDRPDDPYTSNLGKAISLAFTQPQPYIRFKRIANHPDKDTTRYTLVLTDPDAPTRSNATSGEIAHWIQTGLYFDPPDPRKNGADYARDILPYRPPMPPRGSGPHRYVIVMLRPKEGDKEGDAGTEMDLSTPTTRVRWGYQEQGSGVRRWAEANGLEVVGKYGSRNMCAQVLT